MSFSRYFLQHNHGRQSYITCMQIHKFVIDQIIRLKKRLLCVNQIKDRKHIKLYAKTLLKYESGVSFKILFMVCSSGNKIFSQKNAYPPALSSLYCLQRNYCILVLLCCLFRENLLPGVRLSHVYRHSDSFQKSLLKNWSWLVGITWTHLGITSSYLCASLHICFRRLNHQYGWKNWSQKFGFVCLPLHDSPGFNQGSWPPT